MYATASIPIDSGTLYHGAGWKQGGERRVSDTENAKLLESCGRRRQRKGANITSPKDLLCTRTLDLYSLRSVICVRYRLERALSFLSFLGEIAEIV